MIEPTKVTVRFLTPAFLGNAQQHGQWRTPPFKAELRQWWRVVQGSRGRDVVTMRAQEDELFGSAAGDSGRQSMVRLRLDKWELGKLGTWGKLASQTVSVGKHAVASGLYLGYGPLEYSKEVKGPVLKNKAPALDAGATAQLRFAVAPHRNTSKDIRQHRTDLRQALGLMHRFGTVGGRSRNAWGSYELNAVEDIALENYLLDWHRALDDAWVRGLGHDDKGPLLWHTRECRDWEGAIALLAQIRANANRAGGLRALLSYPVTKQDHPGWSGQDRLPSNLRLKVVRAAGGRMRGQIAHFPCRPNDELQDKGRVRKDQLVDVWQRVHAQLDGNAQLTRVPA